MKMQCSIIAILLIGLICLGGGFAVGKATQPITVNNISTSQAISQANSYAISGTITIRQGQTTGLVVLQLSGITNMQFYTVTNGRTNYTTNSVIIK